MKAQTGYKAGMRFIVGLMVLALAACAAQKAAAPPPASPRPAVVDPYANGRAIFMTGRDLAGHRITASPPPLYGSCVQCHRANGAGGLRLPDGAVSADLRHDALTKEQDRPYTIALLERAISRGIDNDGDKLSPVMPRWRMSPTDLKDVAAFVYSKLR